MFSQRKRYIFSYKKKRRAELIKRGIIIVLIVAAVGALLLYFLNRYTSEVRIDLASKRTIELNTPAKASDFIDDFGNVTLVEDQEIDTSTLGQKRCVIKININGQEQEFTFTVDVVDTEPPELTIEETGLNLLIGTPYDVIGKISAHDNSGEEVEITAEGEYDPNTPGEQIIKIVASDASGNKTEQDVTVNVIEPGENLPDMDFLTNNGHTATVRDGVTYVDGILIVNRSFPLPATYGDRVSEAALAAFNEMVNSAYYDEISLDIDTDYRSYMDQEYQHQYYTEVLGEADDTPNTAKAGHSEHQSGLAFDVNNTIPDFAYTSAATWLKDYCWQFGFILRYPEGKEEITGCTWEPWHVRYVGTELAEILYNNGDWITLEEYFGIPSKYPETQEN